MNNITFTGINNLKVYKGRLNTPSENVIRVSAELTDDANGRDFNEYMQKFSRCNPVIQEAYLDTKNPRAVKLDCVRVTKNKYNFRLNDAPLYFNCDEVLPLFNFIASFTKKAQNITTNNDKKALLQNFNENITKEAKKYFDC